MLLLLIGCGDEPEPEAADVVVPIVQGVEVRPEVTALVGDAEAVAVQLQFQGLSGLHRNYFSQPELVGALGVGLGTCTNKPATVLAGWNSEINTGTITWKLDPRDVTCGARPDDLSGLVPAARALAAYRDGIANRYDLRIQAFRVHIELLRGTDLCTLMLGGQFPPSGETFSSCVLLLGNERCAGDKHDGVLALGHSGEDRRALDRCFRP